MMTITWSPHRDNQRSCKYILQLPLSLAGLAKIFRISIQFHAEYHTTRRPLPVDPVGGNIEYFDLITILSPSSDPPEISWTELVRVIRLLVTLTAGGQRTSALTILAPDQYRVIFLILMFVSPHFCPAGQKLSGSSALGSQSQPWGRQTHWTHSLPAEQLWLGSSAPGSQSQPGGKGGWHWQSWRQGMR